MHFSIKNVIPQFSRAKSISGDRWNTDCIARRNTVWIFTMFELYCAGLKKLSIFPYCTKTKNYIGVYTFFPSKHCLHSYMYAEGNVRTVRRAEIFYDIHFLTPASTSFFLLSCFCLRRSSIDFNCERSSLLMTSGITIF